MSTRFYGNAQSLLAFCVIATLVLLLVGNWFNIPLILNLGVGLYICVILLNVWALLFFFRFLPHIGYFVVAVQRMIGDVVKFFIIYALFLIGFSDAFDNVLTLNGFCSGTGFENKIMSLYTTFTTMFDMLDGDSFPNYVRENFTVGLVHILYVMLVGVLLLKLNNWNHVRYHHQRQRQQDNPYDSATVTRSSVSGIHLRTHMLLLVQEKIRDVSCA